MSNKWWVQSSLQKDMLFLFPIEFYVKNFPTVVHLSKFLPCKQIHFICFSEAATSLETVLN
jgi:hypothetical protein